MVILFFNIHMSYLKTQAVKNEFAQRLETALKIPVNARSGLIKLSQSFGVSRQAVDHWLNAVSMPHQSRMPIVAEKLGVSLAWLRDGTGDMLANKVFVDNNNDDKSGESGQKNDKFFINNEELLLIKNYRKVSFRDKGVIKKLLGWFDG
jgi:transcriptional regulator with XRE-family HTH domain